MIEVAGGTPVPVPLDEENDFSLDIQAFDRLINARTRLIILNSPVQPHGEHHPAGRPCPHRGCGDPVR